MNTCKNCKHYLPRPDECKGYGECDIMHGSREIESDNVLLRKEGCYTELFVGENFGCIHFEQKKQ